MFPCRQASTACFVVLFVSQSGAPCGQGVERKRASRPRSDIPSASLPPFHVREAVFMGFNVDHPSRTPAAPLFFFRRAGLSARHLEKVVPSCPSCLQNHCRKLLELSDNLFPSAVLPLSMSAKRFSWVSMLSFHPPPSHSSPRSGIRDIRVEITPSKSFLSAKRFSPFLVDSLPFSSLIPSASDGRGSQCQQPRRPLFASLPLSPVRGGQSLRKQNIWPKEAPSSASEGILNSSKAHDL